MKIGFIGLGIMGESMSENIIKKHDDTVYVFDVVKEKTEKMAALGGVACANARELAEKSDVVITMVPKSEHLTAVYEEILPVFGPGKIGIDMSTIDPGVSVEISRDVKATGAEFIDAPVVKSKPAAIEGTLGIWTTPVQIFATAFLAFALVAIFCVLVQRIPKIGKYIIG